MSNNWGTATAEKPKTLQQWCNDTWVELYRYVYRYVQNREEAEDITQETYAHTFRKWSSPGHLPTIGYLKTVALNLIRDRWRRSKIKGTQVPLEDYMLSTDSQTDRIETQTLVRQLMEKLPEEYGTVLQLRIVEGYSRAETATRMGRTEDSVRGLQYRALQSLKNLMEKYFKEVDPL